MRVVRVYPIIRSREILPDLVEIYGAGFVQINVVNANRLCNANSDVSLN